MMMRSLCCVMLIQLSLIAILPTCSLGQGQYTPVMFPPDEQQDTRGPWYRNEQPITHDSGMRSHSHSNANQDKRKRWEEKANSLGLAHRNEQQQDSPSNQATSFSGESTLNSNQGRRNNRGSEMPSSSSKNRKGIKRGNKNRDAQLGQNAPVNRNTGAQDVVTSRSSQGSLQTSPKNIQDQLNTTGKRQGGRNGRRNGSKQKERNGRRNGSKQKERNGSRNKSKQNKNRSKKSIKIKPNKFLPFQNFGMNLHAAVTNLSDTSFVMSPFSAWSALILAYYGSMGKTMEQFETALGIQKKTLAYVRADALDKLLQDPKSGAILRTTNKAYIANDMVLIKRVAKMLTNVESLNFKDPTKSAFVINNEVSNVTEGKITDLVKPGMIDSMTRFILVNAVYFKGKWVNQFDKKDTSKKNFYDQNGNLLSTVDMMKTRAYYRVGHLENRKGQLLEMQYVGSTVVMHIILPNRGVDLKQLVQSLDQKAFMNALKRTRQLEVDLELPKFKLETTLEDNLEKAIKSLGITDMFGEGECDFSGFTGRNEVSEMKIVQQSVIEVDEEGTEAAAATMIMASRMYTEPKSFVVDRPFAFYINEQKSQVTVFSGLYMGPNV